MNRNSLFLLILASYFYLVVAGTAISTTNSLGRKENQSEDSKSRQLAGVDVDAPKSVTIDSSNTVIHDVGSTNTLTGLGEKSVITVKYAVDDSNTNSLSFGTFANAGAGFEMKNVTFDFQLEDTRTDKTVPPAFTGCGMLGDGDGIVIDNVHFRFHFSFTVKCSETNNGIIAKSVKGDSKIKSLLFTFTDETNPITISYTPTVGKDNNALLFGRMDNGEIKGIAVVGDKIVLNTADDGKKYNFGVISSDKVTATTTQNITVDLLEFIVYDKIQVGGLFFKCASSIESSFFAVRNRYLLGFEEAYVFTTSSFAGLAHDFSGSELAYDFVYLKIDKITDGEQGATSFYGMIKTSTGTAVISCQIYLYSFGDRINNGNNAQYYIGGTVTAIKNSFVHVDPVAYSKLEMSVDRTKMEGIYFDIRTSIEIVENDMKYVEGSVPNYKTGSLNQKDFIYFTEGLSLTDDGIRTPSNYDSEKNSHLMYKYIPNSRIPTMDLLIVYSTLSEDVTFSGQGDVKETTIVFQLLSVPTSDVKIGVMCDSFLSGGGCNDYSVLNNANMKKAVYVKLDYQALEYWKTCITFNVSSSDSVFNDYKINSICFYAANTDPSVTLPSTGVECKEGGRLQYNIGCKWLIVNYDVYLGDKKIHEAKSVGIHRGRLFVDFTYPTNDIDEGEIYIVTLRTTWYHLSESKSVDTNVTVTNINKAGIVMNYETKYGAIVDNVVGHLKINVKTTPMKPVVLRLDCGSLICEYINIGFTKKNLTTVTVRRGYLTSYDYSRDKTTFYIGGSVSSEDKQYNAIEVNPAEAEVKNDLKAEIKTSKEEIQLSCSKILENEVTVLLGRVPQKDVHISIIPNNKNLIIKPNEFTLNSERTAISIRVTSLSVCRENITEELTFRVTSEDDLYSSSQLSKATIKVNSVVYDHELDKSSAPEISELKLKDNSNDKVEVIFDKIIYMDELNKESKEIDCKIIIKESDVNLYGLSECKVINENVIEMKFNKDVVAGSSSITFNKDVIRSSNYSINALKEITKVISDRTPKAELVKANFNDNGNQIIVIFDREIYGISSDDESCSNVFNNENLGENCKIRKSVSKTMIIILGNGASINAGEKLILSNKNVIVSSEGHINCASGEISVDYPSSYPSVKAVINGGNKLYECGELKLNGLSSEGNYGRAFKYEWSSSSENDNRLLKEAIEKANNDNDGYLTIKGDVDIPESFDISLKVISFLNPEGDSTSITITKDKSTSRYLEVSIDGKNEMSYKKDEMFDISGRGLVKACGNQTVIVDLTYEWSCRDINSDESISIDNFITGDVKTISIEKGELEIGDYEFTVKVSGDGLESSNKVLVHIIPRDLVIVLNGASNRNVAVNSEVILDISSSYDPDNYENNFLYSWECEMNNHEICSKMDNSVLILESKSIVIIGGNTLKVKNVYKFRGKMLGIKSQRSVSTLVTVNVLDENIDLSVEIIVLNPKMDNIYSHDYLLELYGNVSGDYSPLSFEWIYLNDSSLNIFKPVFDDIRSKEVIIDCSKLLSGKHRVMFRVIYKDYKFESEFEFSVYMPPYGGYIITDKDVVGFGEKVIITTSGWVSLTSLKYRFAAKVGEKVNYLNDYSVNKVYEGILPVGLSSDDYKLKIIVYAIDIYDGIGETDRRSGVNEKMIIRSLEPSGVVKINETINELKRSNDHNQVFVVIDGVSSNLERHCMDNTGCSNNGECINNKCKCNKDYMGDNCEKHKPIDCVLSKEYEYGEYNKACGLAEREKWHKIETSAKYGGKECEIIKEKEMKVLGACVKDIDGGWGNWSEYSDCDVKCEIYNSRDIIGKQYRSRVCNNPIPSGNGKYCEGENIEYRKCIVSCKAPLKPCPGEYIDSDGELKGLACNGRGSCERSRTGCKAYEPGCYSYCNCTDGYTGESCNYNETEKQSAAEINKVLINSYKTSLNKIHNSGDIHSTLSSNLKKMSKSYSILESDTKSELLNLIGESVDKVGKSKSSNLPLDAMKQYVEATSTLLENEGRDRKLRRSRLLEEGNGKNFVKIIDDIGKVYSSSSSSSGSSGKSSESLNVNTDEISLTCQSLEDNNNNLYNRVSKSTESTKETSIGSSDLTLMDNYGSKSVELVEWNTIPIPTNDDDNLVSGMITINLHKENGEKNEVKDENKPIYFRQKINNAKSMKDVECSYLDETTGEVKTEGVYVSYIEKMEDGSVFVTCATTHLSSFSIKANAIIPKMNVVNPISDAKLLLNYSLENALVPIILGSVLLICVLSWSYTKYKDSEELSIVTQEKANKFLSIGILDEAGKKAEIIEKDLKMSLVKNFALRMKSDHSWLAPALREADEIIVINRSQRILCLTCQVLTSTAINALFFGMNAENVAQLISTSIISTLCMLPCTILVPWLYKYANGCTSKTISNKRKWWRLKSLKNRFKSYFTSGITSPELRRLKIGLLSTSSIYVIFAFIFYIVSLIVMPFGVPSLLITACLIVFVLETIFSLIATNLTERVPFIFLFVVDLIMFIIDVIFLVLCASIANGSTGMCYNMWKAMYKNVAMKEFNIYIENNLNCCGFRDIDDYNIQDCLNPDLLASGFKSRSCEIPLVDNIKKYGAFWGIFFVVSMMFMLCKCFINLNYIFVNYNKVIEDNLGDFNSEITQKAGQKIITLLRRSVLKNKVRRKREYIEWLRQRRMRSIITVCVNATVFIYILMMIYINLLYGVKFAPHQANSWIISSTISMAIDVFIQQPSLILLNSVASSTLGAVLNFAR